MEPAAPASAEPISPSLAELVSAWNQATAPLAPDWAIEDLPPVNEAGSFEIDVAPRVWLNGAVNLSTDRVVEVTVFVEGTEVGSGPGRGDHHGAAHDGGGGEAHHATGAATPPVELDVPTVRHAVAALIQATTDAQPDRVESVLGDLRVEAAARLPASEADGELVEVIAFERNFRLQRFPPVLIVSVSHEEPWELPESGG